MTRTLYFAAAISALSLALSLYAHTANRSALTIEQAQEILRY